MFPQKHVHEESNIDGDIETQNGVKILKFKGKEYFSCLGVSSQVMDGESNDTHVLFLDIEDSTLTEVLEMCRDVFNYYAVFKSSNKQGRKNFHVINPVCRSKQQTRFKMMELAKSYLGDNPYSLEDRTHTHIGHLRGDWVLRLSKKPSKQMPQLVESDLEFKQDHGTRLSLPHLYYIQDVYGLDVSCLTENVDVNLYGKNLKTIKYYTYK